MAYSNLTGFQRKWLLNDQPFVSYRLPGADIPVTLLSDKAPIMLNHDSRLPEDEKGFILAPFDVSMPSFWFKADHLFYGNNVEDPYALIDSIDTSGNTSVKTSKHDATSLPGSSEKYQNPSTLPAPTDKENYLRQVEKILQAIRTGFVQKAVLSRNLHIPFHRNVEAPLLFNRLMERFPNAFIYLLSFPGIGCWLGASPELLLHANTLSETREDHTNMLHIETMALAGTRKVNAPDPWGQKEIDEQEWVVKYIEKQLYDSRCTSIEKSGTYTCFAGNVEHLRTDFKALLPSNRLSFLLHSMHPTPAVCGWPAPESLELIIKTEHYLRSYYSGYLGPVNMDRKTSLFVNLRCMQIAEKEAALYAGGGITHDSVPEAEWEETAIKSRTLLAEIEKIQNLAT